MGIEFLVEDAEPEDSCHQLEFRFRGKYDLFSGHLIFTPELAVVHMERPEHPNKVLSRLRGLVQRLKTSYSTLFAKVALETSPEVLERENGLVTAVQTCFPNAVLTGANKQCLTELSDAHSCAVEDYTAMCKVLPEAAIGGEDVVDFLINTQGKIFKLAFYNKVKRGVKLSDFVLGYAEPAGVLKGVLLKSGYTPYIVKGNNGSVRYMPGSVKVPDGFISVRPF
ncbi:MAG TPA: hypothetical protein VI612_05605 [Candidatus Nanoarchaeia archaeon]|nr:hypothetical protein [Candidatus Nanoarchaeia archaeon]